MARIPSYQARQGLSPAAMPDSNVIPYQARALEQLGGAITDASSVFDKLAERQQQKENFMAENAYRRFGLDMQNSLEDAKLNSMPEGGTGFYDDFMKNTFTPKRDKFLETVPDRLKERFAGLLDPSTGSDYGEWSNKAAAAERDATVTWATNEVKATQDQLATAISLNPDAYEETLAAGRSVITSAPIPMNEKQVLLREWENMAQVAHLNRLLDDDPEAVMKALGVSPNKMSPPTQFKILSDAVQYQETRNNPNQISPAGAVGSHQVMPGTARWMNKAGIIADPNFNPDMDQEQLTQYLLQPGVSREYGETYLRYLQKKYPNDLEAVLIAYNGGPGRADKWIKSGRDDSVLPGETRNYYKEIISRLPGSAIAAPGAPDSVKFTWVRDGGMAALTGEQREKINPDLMERVSVAYAAVGLTEVRVRSGHRSPKANKKAGGVSKSQHLTGNALDIDVTNMPHEKRLEVIRALSSAGITGIGVYANTIHADMGSRRAWGPSHHGDSVPKWARATIAAHLEGKLTKLGGATANARYATLPYDKRQQFINAADTELARRMREGSRATAVAKVEMRQDMSNELALIAGTGKGSGGFDDGAVATTLGEAEYLEWVQKRDEAQRMFVAKDGMITMSQSELADQIRDYEPNELSADYASDQKIHAAVVKEAERIERMRASDPGKAAMEFPDVRGAYDKMQKGIADGTAEPADVTEFVRLMIEHQKGFGVKPDAVAPIPREWAFEIGQSLTRVPQPKGGNVADVRAAIAVQYQALQKYFGEYTDEVILYALTEYKGLNETTAKMITGMMQSIAVGGDPFRMRDQALDQQQVESATEPGWFDWLWGGEESSSEASPEAILRAKEALGDASTPEEVQVLEQRYGKAAVDAARFQIEQGAQ